MPNKKPHSARQGRKPTGRRGLAVSLHPLTPEQAVSAMFKISKADVARIVASRPGKRRKKK